MPGKRRSARSSDCCRTVLRSLSITRKNFDPGESPSPRIEGAHHPKIVWGLHGHLAWLVLQGQSGAVLSGPENQSRNDVSPSVRCDADDSRAGRSPAGSPFAGAAVLRTGSDPVHRPRAGGGTGGLHAETRNRRIPRGPRGEHVLLREPARPSSHPMTPVTPVIYGAGIATGIIPRAFRGNLT